MEFTVFTLDSQALGAFFNMADNLRVDIESAGDFNYLLSNFGIDIDFHSVTAVEHLVHLLPVSFALFLDELKQRRDGEHVVLHHLAVVAYEMEHLGLGTTCAMHHAVDFRSEFVEHHLDDRSIGAGGGEHKLSGCDFGLDNSWLGILFHDGIAYGHFVGQAFHAAIHQFVGHLMVETLGIFLGKILRKHIMAG